MRRSAAEPRPRTCAAAGRAAIPACSSSALPSDADGGAGGPDARGGQAADPDYTEHRRRRGHRDPDGDPITRGLHDAVRARAGDRDETARSGARPGGVDPINGPRAISIGGDVKRVDADPGGLLGNVGCLLPSGQDSPAVEDEPGKPKERRGEQQQPDHGRPAIRPARRQVDQPHAQPTPRYRSSGAVALAVMRLDPGNIEKPTSESRTVHATVTRTDPPANHRLVFTETDTPVEQSTFSPASAFAAAVWAALAAEPGVRAIEAALAASLAAPVTSAPVSAIRPSTTTSSRNRTMIGASSTSSIVPVPASDPTVRPPVPVPVPTVRPPIPVPVPAAHPMRSPPAPVPIPVPAADPTGSPPDPVPASK